MTKLTAHSEIGRIKSVLMKHPKDAFISQKLVNTEWQSLNFLEEPIFDNAVDEFESLKTIIEKHGGEVLLLPPSSDVTLDSVYCRDASLVTDFGIILCNMGKEKRTNEPKAERRYFEQINQTILGTIAPPGTLEGGDVVWLNESTLAVGHTYRTNYAGISQLKMLLETKGIEILVAEMPHYRGKADVFHLMSVLSPVDYKKAVVYSQLMPIHFRNELLELGFELIEVPDDEFESMGSNVLAIAPSECIVVDGNPITKLRLEEAGCRVHPYKGEDISIKGGGGPTCLTRPILREV